VSLLRTVQEEVLERLGRVGVAARHAVENILQGQHRSIHRGLSVEFAGHRPYAPGDDPRHLDWKVWARTDRYDVRMYEEETRLRATLVVDYSGSMAYGAAPRPWSAGVPVTKLHFARVLSAALAFLMVRQGDSVGLAVVDDGIRHLRPASATMGHVLNLLELLEDEAPGGETGLGPVITEVAQRLSRRGLVILLTDGLDDPDELLRSLQHLHYRKQDIRILLLEDPDEAALPFGGACRFVGLEGEDALELDADRIRRAYQDAVADHHRRLQAGCHDLGAALTRCSSDEDPAAVLVRALVGDPTSGRERR
jgi:uncharacterized protein (DUF58 family)